MKARVLKAGLILVALLLLALVIGPFLIPVPELKDTVEPQELAGPNSQFVDVQGLVVHYISAGPEDSPDTLVLLHGFAASTFSWEIVLDRLAEGPSGPRRVIAFDRPAFGLTERPLEWEGSNPYSLEAQAELTVGLMDALGIERAVLIGNSAGGTAAVQTALQYPERVQALILVDPAIYTGGGLPEWSRSLLQTPQARRLGPLLARQIQQRGRTFAESAWHDPEKITDEIWEGYTRPLQVKDWDKALWEHTAASRPHELADRLPKLQLPVLVITGDDDRIVPTEDSIRLAGDLPNAELVVIPQCGHVPQEECPEPFLEAVEAFLERILEE